jgi:hypothetical protein
MMQQIANALVVKEDKCASRNSGADKQRVETEAV